MIICKNCGKMKIYKTREIVTREIIYGESGMVHDFKLISEKESKPRCIKCGRLVKFFKDEESEE